MQETKASQAGQINLDWYFTYEVIRSNKEGGCFAISALNNLCPAFVRDGGDNAEAVTIDVHVRNMTIYITSAYGPQESALIEKKTNFWNYLHDDAKKNQILWKRIYPSKRP